MRISLLLFVLLLSGCSLTFDGTRQDVYTCINPEPCFENPFYGVKPHWDA